MQYRLGLDIGTNSIGWSVLKVGENQKVIEVSNAGARIFSDGRDKKTKATLAADRRGARGVRRRRDRFLQRQDYLIKVLTEAKLFPEKKEEQKELQKQDPLKLRAEALSRKLECFEIGRALFHINQRRGFKSNRKDRSDETTSGKVSDSVRELLEQMELIGPDLSKKEEYKTLPKEKKKEARQKEARERLDALSKLADKPLLTYGSFLWSRRQQGFSTRARFRVEEKLYDVYPQRELYKDEFNKIWQAQAQHHLGVMSVENREHIFNVIFSQRPLKPQERGRCTYLPDEKRAFRAMPSCQRYRMYQEVNNLEWVTSEGVQRLRDNREARDKIIDLLEKPTNKKNSMVLFTKMRTCLKKLGITEEGVQFNLQTLKREGLKGNDTARKMRNEDCVGEQWDTWSPEKQDRFIEIIFEQVPDKSGKLREQTDEEVCQRLVEEFGLEELRAEECMNTQFDDGTASLSLKAAKLLIEKMKNDCLNQYYAVQAVVKENSQFQNPEPSPEDELLDNLPYYGEVFGKDGRHIIPGKLKPEEKGNDLKYYGGVTNPTVHIALNQIRQVINELISRYGRPASISIELARDLPVGAEGRREIEDEQKKNQEKNEEFNKKLKECGETLNQDNRLRLRLWEELGKSPQDRLCPFSGERICLTDLFENGRIEIEHLIPFSRSLDDSRANKVLCIRGANRYKGNRTPFEAFGDSRDGYNWARIMECVKSLPLAKQWRFREDAMKIWNKDHDDFSERHLNDTRYIGRIAKEYLGYVCPVNKIDVVTGRLTAMLRWQWGLDSILNDSSDKTTKTKNRDDHRHHAIDAVVIGMTSRSMLQAVATAAERGESMHLESIFEKKKNGASIIDPWENFRNEVQQVINGINVSHRVSHKKQGQLHKETAYGIANKRKIKELNENPKNAIAKKVDVVKVDVVFRKSIDEFTTAKHVKEIRDKKLREKFLQSFNEKGKGGMKELAKKETTGRNPIRHLRVIANKTVQPIRDKEKQVYKSYALGNNWATEIYQIPSSGLWKDFVISMFEATQKNFQPGVTKRPEPTAKLVMRLFNQDMLQITEKNGEKRLMRVHKMSEGIIYICEHQLANVAQRLEELRRMKLCYQCSITRLREFQAKKVYISPTGLVRFAK